MLQPAITEGPTPSAQDLLHRDLSELNRLRFTPGLPHGGWRQQAERVRRLSEAEAEFLEEARQAVAGRAASAPQDPDGFVAWYEDLERTGPGQGDPLFPWLAEHASLAEFSWFLTQEVAGEAGFEDLLALTQLKMPVRPKLELARNYWDEMGRGNRKGMHGLMLDHLSRALRLKPEVETTVWESLALANTMAGLAADRRYAYHSIGALGAIELTAPGRSALVAQGLKRLGIPADSRHYFDLHAVLDVKHSQAWVAEVIRPLVAGDPRVAPAIAEGALMRLACGERCFIRYRRELGLA